jgi:hypothetical protein
MSKNYVSKINKRLTSIKIWTMFIVILMDGAKIGNCVKCASKIKKIYYAFLRWVV